jgi:capsular polysaccharide biosynthesis protein
MKISYQNIMGWMKKNIKALLILEVICLSSAAFYYAVAPRIYEANFSISLPRVPAVGAGNSGAAKLKLMISPQEFIRPTQDPMGYPAIFMDDCMGKDTNANRKQFINGLQLGVKQNGDVIAFTLRLESEGRTAHCANLLLSKVLNDLVLAQEGYLKSSGQDFSAESYQKPSMIQAVRMSDSFIKPDLTKLLISAFLLGIFITILISIFRKRYCA